MPMAIGKATIPIPRADPTAVELNVVPKTNVTKAIAAPHASHFSCWRRSPVDRRQLRNW